MKPQVDKVVKIVEFDCGKLNWFQLNWSVKHPTCRFLFSVAYSPHRKDVEVIDHTGVAVRYDFIPRLVTRKRPSFKSRGDIVQENKQPRLIEMDKREFPTDLALKLIHENNAQVLFEILAECNII